MRRVLLFVHGVIDDDPAQRWSAKLDLALRREGGPNLEELGWETPAVSYLDLLEAEASEACEMPEETRQVGDEEARRRALADYLVRLGDLQRHLVETRTWDPPVWTPPLAATDWAVRHLSRPVFLWAREYTRDADKRACILRRVLEAIPAECELVVVGHSLGSVIAADLIYHLPPGANLRLLVSTGSPLSIPSLSKHLRRVNRQFPAETVGAWLNLVGAGDLVTGGRGLARQFPEVLDRVVDTGRDPKGAHDAARYMDEGTFARALVYLRAAAAPPAESANAPAVRVPDELLLPLALAQHALRIERSLPRGDRRDRFAVARRLHVDETRGGLRASYPSQPVAGRLGHDNHEAFRGRISPAEQVQLLVAARRWNPIEPWEVEVPDDVRRAALEAFAADIGAPAEWATVVWEAEASARESLQAKWNLGRAALVGAGVITALAAPALVLAAAPAGLAGGAALVGGLTALGPGGMVGGLAVVGAVSGAGGAVAARGLASGSAEAVEENVIAIQTLAAALHRLDLEPSEHAHWFVLVAMEQTLESDLRSVQGISDASSAHVKQLTSKLRSIRSALAWMSAQGLGPAELDG